MTLNNGGYTNIIVYDQLGKIVYSSDILKSEMSVQINLQGNLPGIYYLRSMGDGKCETIPFVINR